MVWKHNNWIVSDYWVRISNICNIARVNMASYISHAHLWSSIQIQIQITLLLNRYRSLFSILYISFFRCIILQSYDLSGDQMCIINSFMSGEEFAPETSHSGLIIYIFLITFERVCLCKLFKVSLLDSGLAIRNSKMQWNWHLT